MVTCECVNQVSIPVQLVFLFQSLFSLELLWQPCRGWGLMLIGAFWEAELED